MASIIIPFYNEEKELSEKAHYFKELAECGELIFVDGGSRDAGAEAIKALGRVLQCKKGRAAQMNYGAVAAASDTLLFLHADAKVDAGAIKNIEAALAKDKFVGGCLTQKINAPGAVFRFIENFGNVRARLRKVFYGDQGIFVRKGLFIRMGGFPEVPIMEDVIFTKRLRRQSKTIVLPDKITVSARRWQKRGIIRTVFLHSFINVLFYLKVPLEKIKLLYDDLR